jgi:diguanylate cyclase (GGDEF)-like protein/PAS domain S-box-containing protein
MTRDDRPDIPGTTTAADGEASPDEHRARLLEALAERTSAALERDQVETVHETALLVGLDGQIQARSQQTVDRLSHRPEDPAWPGRSEQGAAEALAQRQAEAKARLSEGRAVRYIERKEGRVRDCSLHPILGEDGQLKAFAGFTRDITEQLRLQERVHQAAAFQRALFSSLSEGILVLDEHDVILDCNRAVESTLGMDRPGLVGRCVAELCAQAASWEEWERELRPRLEPGGEPVQLELRMRRADGASFTARVSATRIALDGAESSVVWTVRDVTDELLRFAQLQHMATHDALTGLPNRLLFRDRLGRAVESARRYRKSFAVMMMDLDGFKPVNDTLGHEVGDRLLTGLGERLDLSLRAADTVSRLGGDEFAVLLPNSITAEQALQVGAKLLEVIEQPFTMDGRELRVSASIGVAMYPEHHGSEADLLAQADQAMYVAKRQGGRRVVMASGDDQAS